MGSLPRGSFLKRVAHDFSHCRSARITWRVCDCSLSKHARPVGAERGLRGRGVRIGHSHPAGTIRRLSRRRCPGGCRTRWAVGRPVCGWPDPFRIDGCRDLAGITAFSGGLPRIRRLDLRRRCLDGSECQRRSRACCPHRRGTRSRLIHPARVTPMAGASGLSLPDARLSRPGSWRAPSPAGLPAIGTTAIRWPGLRARPR
jgi:hypothetical protein